MTDERHDQVRADDGPFTAARQRILLERLAHLEAELEGVKSELESLRKRQNADALTLRAHEARMARLRLDKQLRSLPRWLMSRFRSGDQKLKGLPAGKSPADLLVVAPKYPSKRSPYGGQPVERRLSWYTRAGFNPVVFVPSKGASYTERRDGVDVVRADLTELRDVVSQTGRSQILIHHPTPDVWEAVRQLAGKIPIHLWIHGFEARDWRDADFESTPDELSEKAVRLDPINFDRRHALAEVFADDRVSKIFISEYVRGVATNFVGVEPSNVRVIHNVIDTDIFDYVRREADSRLRILTIKSFAARTYATDLVRHTIEELARRAVFEQLEFEIRGDGKYFDDDTEPLTKFSNVKVRRGFTSAPEMASLMHANGVLLSPTRLDTQGITMGEAMATGMAIITNRVAAIPEFVDSDSGILVEPEDVEGLADAIELLCEEPDRFVRLSENAARRVRAQCAPPVTVQKEIELIRRSVPASRG